MTAGKIQLLGASKVFPGANGAPVRALDPIDLTIEPGEIFCLLGPSGCGKTTLVNLIAGFERPTSGRVLLDGAEVRGPGPRAVVVLQEFGLFPWRTALSNVEFGLEVAGVEERRRVELARAALAAVDLAEAEDRHPRELSGGMRQRVALARALAVDPEVILMDEPFGSLDALTRLRLQNELQAVWERSKKTILFVTHDVDEAIYLGMRVGVMTSTPGRIQRILEIPLGRPRRRASVDFLHIKARIYKELGLLEPEIPEVTI